MQVVVLYPEMQVVDLYLQSARVLTARDQVAGNTSTFSDAMYSTVNVLIEEQLLRNNASCLQ